MKTIVFVLALSSILLIGSSPLHGQEREAGDSSMMDFWIGTWDLVWDWEISQDGGKTWNLNWQTRYKRAD